MKSHRDLLVPDGFVYLRVDPNVALERMAARNRHEESAVPLAYLEGLHQKHEDWFMSRKTVSDLLRGGPSSAAGQRLAAGIGAGRGGAMEGGLLDLALPERMPWRREAGEREGGAGTPWEEWRVGADEFLPSPPEDIAGEVYLLNPTVSASVVPLVHPASWVGREMARRAYVQCLSAEWSGDALPPSLGCARGLVLL